MLWNPICNIVNFLSPSPSKISFVEDAEKSSFVNNSFHALWTWGVWRATNWQPPIWVWCHLIAWVQPTEQNITWNVTPYSQSTLRHWVSSISPTRKSSRSELSKELEKNSQWLCSPFFSLILYLELFAVVDTTGLYYRLLTSHSFSWWEALNVKKKKKIPAGCMGSPHSSHSHYWGVCMFFWYPCSQTMMDPCQNRLC